MAASFRLLGEDGRLALFLLNFVWLAASCFVVYRLGKRLAGAVAGWVTVLLLALWPLLVPPARGVLVGYIGSAAPAGFLIGLTALMLVSCIERPTIRRGLALGSAIGLCNLTHAGSILFAPISAIMIVWGSRIRTRLTWRTTLTMLLVSGLVVSPWMVRNYATFGRMVPLRNGGGFQLYIGNPALARTFAGGNQSGGDQVALPWTAGSPSEAVAMLTDLEKDRALRNHSLEIVRASAPEGYERFNEAQRDSEFGKRAQRFIISRPVLVGQLMTAKAFGFFFTNWDRRLGIITVLALLGGVVTLRDRRVIALTMLILTYAVPYILSSPLYYRYRSPIEPLMLVLAGLLAATAARARAGIGARLRTAIG